MDMNHLGRVNYTVAESWRDHLVKDIFKTIGAGLHVHIRHKSDLPRLLAYASYLQLLPRHEIQKEYEKFEDHYHTLNQLVDYINNETD